MAVYPISRAKLATARARVASLVAGKSFPIDLSLIADELGIVVIEDDIGSLDAFIQPEGDHYLAVVNSRALLVRRRFSLAHEFGHVIIARQISDPEFRLTNCENSRTDPIEQACNQLASDILMPPGAFAGAADTHGWSLGGAVEMADTFGASIEASIRRCVDLAPNSLIMAKWRVDKASVKSSIMYTHSKRMNISGFDYQEGEYSSVHEGHSSGKIWWGTVDYQVLLRESAVVRRTQENRIVPVRGGRHNRSRVSTAFKGIPTEFLTIGRGENPVMFSLGHIPDSSPLPKASG